MNITNKYVQCTNCGHQASLFKVFGTTGATAADMRIIKSKIPQLVCTKCTKVGCVTITDETRQSKRKYLASTERNIFHKPSCGWLNNTSDSKTREFASRASAISAGCSPCRFCKP